MALAISGSDCPKFLIPVSQCGGHIAGLKKQPLHDYVQECAEMLLEEVKK